jgi:hypothetical protein
MKKSTLFIKKSDYHTPYVIMVIMYLVLLVPGLYAGMKSSTSSGPMFWENKGQIKGTQGEVREDVLFAFKSKELNLFLLDNGLSYQFHKTSTADPLRTELYRIDMRLKGANSTAQIIRAEKGTEVHHDLRKGISNIQAYGRVTYKDIYPNIDWVIFSQPEGIKHEFVVYPGGNPNMIRMEYLHQESLQIKEGSLYASSSMGTIQEKAPITFQNGKIVPSAYAQYGNEIGFIIPEFNPNQVMIIDPTIVWATYFGGMGMEEGGIPTTDLFGNVYLAGYTGSNFFGEIASSGGYQTMNGGRQDAFLVKFDANGNRLWSTYFGGESDEVLNMVKTDHQGNVYIAGITLSTTGIGSIGSHQSTISSTNTEGFLTKFDTHGNLIWSTYYGGNSNDIINDIVIDSLDNIYIVGTTNSANGIAQNGHENDNINNAYCAFLAKFNTSGVRQWGTYLKVNMPGSVQGVSIALDPVGNILISGRANDIGMATPPFQNTFQGDYDHYVAKFSPQCQLLWSRYFGGSGIEGVSRMQTDILGNIYILGETTSSTGIATLGMQTQMNGNNGVYLAKLDSSGHTLWATYTAFQYTFYSGGMSIRTNGNPIIAGVLSDSTGFVLNGIFNPLLPHLHAGSQMGFTEYDSTGHKIWGDLNSITPIYRTKGLHTDHNNFLYLSGDAVETLLAPFPFSTFQTQITGGYDCALLKINLTPSCDTSTIPILMANADTVCLNQNVQLSVIGGALNGATAWQWYSGGCGNTGVGTGTSITMQIQRDTIVYVRGEGGCSVPGACDSIRITLRPGITNNQISSGHVMCSATFPSLITGSIPTGTQGTVSYSWEYSNDEMFWQPEYDATQRDLQYQHVISSSFYFRRTVSDQGVCPSSISNSSLILVSGTAGNIISGNQTVMPSTIPGILSGSNPESNHTFQWEVSNDSVVWNVISGETQQDYQPAFPNTTQWYRRTMTSPSCAPSTSNVVRLIQGSYFVTIPSDTIYLCEGGNLHLSVNSSYPMPVDMYSWYGPTFYSTNQNNTINSVQQSQHGGTYSIIVMHVDGYTEIRTIYVHIYPVINRQLVSSNSPICQGGTLALTAPDIQGITYTWNGPGGFSSGNAASYRYNVTTAMAGAYTLTTSYPAGSCPDQPYVVNVVVTNASLLTAGSNTPICSGSAVYLTSSLIPGGSYLWTGPNGFQSSIRNPSISNSQVTHSGIYTLTVTGNACGASVVTTHVVVSQNPSTAVLSANSPVCEGNTLILSATEILGAGYVWRGPNNFTSTNNPASISNINKEGEGNYRVEITVPGCPSVNRSIGVVVLPGLLAIPTANSPLCTGSVLYLSTRTISGVTYLWQGPLGFQSNQQNPSRSLMTIQRGGIYTLTVSSACGSVSSTVTVDVFPNLAGISVSPSQTLCAGSPLTLTGTAVSGATISWLPPNQLSVPGSTLHIPSVDLSHQGTYLYRVVTPNCGTLSRNVNITIMNPAAISGSVNSPVCIGAPLYMNAAFVAGATYNWQGPNGFISNRQNPSRIRMATGNAGIYTLTVTLPVCGATILNFPVAVVPCREGNFESEANDADTIDEAISLNLYPNPAHTEVHVTWNGHNPVQLDIIDLQGKVLLQIEKAQGNEAIIDVRNLPSGVYWVRYTSGIHHGVTKLIKH